MLIALAPIACGTAAPDSHSVQRDSANVRIVESSRPLWSEDEVWTVDTIPVLDLTETGEGPEHEFYRIRDVIALRDGAVAVATYSSSDIRVFSAAGRHLRRYGRKGEGPGEFDRLASIHEMPGDSILAFDSWLGRFTIFDRASGGVRTFGGFDSTARIEDIALLDNGRIVTINYILEQLVDYGVYRMLFAIRTVDMTLGAPDSVAVIPGFEGFQFDRGDAPPLFRKDGFVAVHGDRVYLGYGDSLEVSVYGGTGNLERVMRVPGFDLRVTDAEIAAERAALAPQPDWPAFLRDVNAALPAPATRPAYEALLVDALGFVWAPEYLSVPESGQPLDCNIFSPEGEWLGSVRLPAHFTPHEIGEDFVLGVLRDELDAEHVQVLRLQRSSG